MLSSTGSPWVTILSPKGHQFSHLVFSLKSMCKSSHKSILGIVCTHCLLLLTLDGSHVPWPAPRAELCAQEESQAMDLVSRAGTNTNCLREFCAVSPSPNVSPCPNTSFTQQILCLYKQWLMISSTIFSFIFIFSDL